MTKVLLPLATAASLAIGAVASPAAFASDPAIGYGGTVGALAVETRGLPTTPAEVRAQGGFATAGAVHWTRASAETRAETLSH